MIYPPLTIGDCMQRQLSLLTYNVWVDNDQHADNQVALIAYFVENSFDVMCLQEVTRQFYQMIQSNTQLAEQYDFVAPAAHQDIGRRFGDLLMVKKDLNALLHPQEILINTTRGRYLASCSVVIEGVKLNIGSAHIESVFFSKESTQIKAVQFDQISNSLTSMQDPDAIIFAGDCNLTGAECLEDEDAIITKNALIDLWKAQHPDMNEMDQDDEDYRANHITWDGTNNPKVPYEEYHRPDRVFMRLFKPAVVKVEKMERVVTDMSDHYGLSVVFSIVRNVI